MCYCGASTFVAADHNEDEHPSEQLFAHLFAFDFAIEQRLYCSAGRVFALLSRQRHCVGNNFEASRLGFF